MELTVMMFLCGAFSFGSRPPVVVALADAMLAGDNAIRMSLWVD